MESIQRIVPEGSPPIALAQQGAEVVGQVIAVERSVRNHQEEPSLQEKLNFSSATIIFVGHNNFRRLEGKPMKIT
jgi:hypothetical protein